MGIVAINQYDVRPTHLSNINQVAGNLDGNRKGAVIRHPASLLWVR